MRHDLKITTTGRYKLIRYDRNLNVISETPWCKNLLTGVGLDFLLGATSSAAFQLHCVVGDGNTAPAIGDTTLTSYLGKYSACQALVDDKKYDTPPYHVRYTTTHRFWPGSLGSSPVNIAEVGMIFGTAYSSINASTPIGSHALTVDNLGNPTSVPYDAANEYLDVVWEWTWLVPDSVTGTLSADIEGVPTATDWEIRPARMNASIGSTQPRGWGGGRIIQGSEPGTTGFIEVHRPYPFVTTTSSPANATWASDGEIQSASQGITGTYNNNLVPNTFTFSPYTNGNYYRNMTMFWGMNNGNAAGGISAVQIGMDFGQWQVGYDPAIPKDGTTNLELSFRLSIANA